MKNLGLVCSSCGDDLMEWEIPLNVFEIDEDEIECIPCEFKFRDSSDIDNFGV